MPLPPLPRPEHPDPYTVHTRRAIYDNPWIRLREDIVSHRSGADQRRYSVVGFHKTACGVVALDDRDRVVLVGQWRYPLETYSWEIPEGGGEPGESPFETLRRELAEEAGLEARIWEPLIFHHPSNSSTDEESFVMLATGLAEVTGQADDDEELHVHREPFADCLRRVLSGEISDGLTVVALLALQARRSGCSEPLAPELAERFFQRPQDHPSPGRARWQDLPR
ncbi:MAG TPA: NUDIX hydrolase [Holophagaceae bacterium]|nr:NUDIX hydrolase [Holophagaceae bacterium]